MISDTDSPLFGQIIPLINSTIDNNSGLTAPTVISASETSGVIRHNRFQGHHHTFLAASAGSSVTIDPILTRPFNPASYRPDTNPAGQGIGADGTNGTPRTGSTTEQNNITATFYMRIK